MPQIDDIVAQYRRESRARTDGANVELELRFTQIDFDIFRTIFGKLCKLVKGELSQTVNSIMQFNTKSSSLDTKYNKIREISFNGTEKISEQIRRKKTLAPPAIIVAELKYKVALALESPEQAFISDESAVVRIKNRVRFPVKIDKLDWSVDMTIARYWSAMGDKSTNLKDIIAEMFGHEMTAETMLEVLGMEDPLARKNYVFEIEAEFLGPPDQYDALKVSDITAIAKYVSDLVDKQSIESNSLQVEIYKIAQYFIRSPGYLANFESRFGLKKLLPPAVSITKSEYRNIFPPKNYFVTDKADGVRAVAAVYGAKAMILLANNKIDFATKSQQATLLETIVDGEYVEKTKKFYAFDVIAINGRNVTRDAFEIRIVQLAAAVQILVGAGIPATAKTYYPVIETAPKDLKTIFSSAMKHKEYEVDGVILVEPGKPYESTITYKWKPAHHNTIDFLIKLAPAGHTFPAKKGKTLYYLFVGINGGMYFRMGLTLCADYKKIFPNTQENYFPVQFTLGDVPLAYLYYSDAPDLDGKIGELRCPGKCDAAGGFESTIGWELVRIRDDRSSELKTGAYFGNDYRIAESIWINYIDPFPIEQLWDGPGSVYFMRDKPEMYRAQTHFINSAKGACMEDMIKGVDIVVDIGVGKGQDLKRYLGLGIKHLVAIDSDRSALSELIRRRYQSIKQYEKSMSLHALVANVNDPHKKLIERLKMVGVHPADALVCNLAVHYFMYSAESMHNFVALAKAALKPGAKVLLTIIDGAAVFELLKDIKSAHSWDAFDKSGTIKKFSIQKMYTSKKFESNGQKIGVLLPFSEGQYYEEYLVNVGALTKEFERAGFKQLYYRPILEHRGAYKRKFASLEAELDAADQQWLSLYYEVGFQSGAA